MSEIDFWNKTSEKFVPHVIDLNVCEKSLGSFLPQINQLVEGKGKVRILDLGCGTGELSIYLAKRGFLVTGIDSSSKSIAKAKIFAETNSCSANVNFHCANVFTIAESRKKYDLIIGKHILHHIEPFERFPRLLKDCLTDAGVGLFHENSANNSLLMFCRKHLAGKFGIPRYGDISESPLSQTEINHLKKHFLVKQIWDDFIFFRYLSIYIFRNDSNLNRLLGNFFIKADKFCFRSLPFLHRYSYDQIIVLEPK